MSVLVTVVPTLTSGGFLGDPPRGRGWRVTSLSPTGPRPPAWPADTAGKGHFLQREVSRLADVMWP